MDKYLNDEGLSLAWEIIKTYFGIGNRAVDGLQYKDNKLYLTAGGEIVSEGIEIAGNTGNGSNLPLSVVDGKLCVTYTQE